MSEQEIVMLKTLLSETRTRLAAAEAQVEALRADWQVYLDTPHDVLRALRLDLAAARRALERASKFIDYTVREWLPNEHTNCGIDSGCAHGAMEREMFERLDAEVDAITHLLAPERPRET
jgi:hypothetical protein